MLPCVCVSVCVCVCVCVCVRVRAFTDKVRDNIVSVDSDSRYIILSHL